MVYSLKMKLLTATLLILSFTAIGVFGVMAMHPDSPHAVTRCLASLAQGASCPEGSAFSIINFHLGTVKNFVSVILIFGFLFLIALALNVSWLSPLLQIYKSENLFEKNFSLHDQRLNHWLAFHENSPNFS